VTWLRKAKTAFTLGGLALVSVACGVKFRYLNPGSQALESPQTPVTISQTLSILANADDGTVMNGSFFGSGNGGSIFPGFWTAANQPTWGFFRFRLTNAIPAGAQITSNTRLRLHGSDPTSTGGNTTEFTSVAAELASNPAAPTLASQIPLGPTIYSDTTGAQWVLGANTGGGDSWAEDTTIVRTGTQSIKYTVVANFGYGYLLSGRTIQPGDFQSVSFDINVGPTASASKNGLLFSINTGAPDVVIANYGASGSFAANTWYPITIPLSAVQTGTPSTWDTMNFTVPPGATLPLSFYIDNVRLETASAAYRITTYQSVIWPNSGSTSYVNGGANMSPSLAPVIQELVDTNSGLAANSHIVLWMFGPEHGDGYANGGPIQTFMPGYSDFSTGSNAPQLTVEYQ
jgi:hypothetical protein